MTDAETEEPKAKFREHDLTIAQYAIKGSIEKWKKIVDGTGVDEGVRNCPPCMEFYQKDCIGCPIFEDTGFRYCEKTPYIAWSKNADFTPGVSGRVTDDKSLQSAKNMLTYLESLLKRLTDVN